MNPLLNSDLFTWEGHFKGTAEASTLGFPVGKFPRQLDVDFGSCTHTYALRTVDEDGTAHYVCTTDDKATLIVFND